MPRLHEILRHLDANFPLSRAESWDRVGLQIGDNLAEISSLFVAYEVSDAVLEAAQNHEAILVYHPLLFRPLESLDFSNPTARLAGAILRRGQHLICLHTALDNAPKPGALGDALAEQLGLQKTEVLAPAGVEKLLQIVVFVPPDARKKVAEAMWEAGAGHVGNYDQASFWTRGNGTFRPREGADPTEGEIGKLEQTQEERLEVLCPENREKEVVAAMRAAHPYEEVAHGIYSVKNTHAPFGSARIGSVKPQSLDEFAAFVKAKLGAPGVRIVRGKNEISRVAVAPGSGASAIDAALEAGADVLVTGDIKHHDALKARNLGIAVIDATHAATETTAVGLMVQKAETLSGLRVTRGQVWENPFE